MTLSRYFLPVSLAAVVHAALILLSPVGHAPALVKLIEVKLRPADPPEQPPVVVTNTGDDPSTAVRPVTGAPPPPEQPEPICDLKRIDFNVDPVPRTDSRIHAPDLKAAMGRTGAEEGPESIFGPIVPYARLDHAPQAKLQQSPDYPADLRRLGVTGSVMVEFDVDATGQVTAARVLHGTRREFEAPTLRAVLRWRFEPGRRFGRAVPFRMAVPVDFHLDGE